MSEKFPHPNHSESDATDRLSQKRAELDALEVDDVENLDNNLASAFRLVDEIQELETEATIEEESNDVAGASLEAPPAYLELKRDYKEKQRAYKEALAEDVKNRSTFKKTFGLGRSQLSPEIQALYDESVVAEKAYYQSFIATQKDRVEARINRGASLEEQKQSIIPALINRHVINPAESRLSAQQRELPPRVQSILNKIKSNKYALGTATAVGLGMKGMSIVSSFGVGLAAGIGSKWAFKQAREFDEKRLKKKVNQFNELFESGEIDELGDIKNEYFQELRRIDDLELAANLTSAGVAVTAGMSFHGSELQADLGDTVTEKAGEYWDAAKEKFGSWFDGEKDVNKVVEDVDVVDVSVPETSDSVTEALTPEEKEQEHTKAFLDLKRAETAAIRDEMWANVAEAEELAKKMGLTIEDIGPKLDYTREGGVITEIEGRPVPQEFMSPDDQRNVDAARQIRGMMDGSIPVSNTNEVQPPYIDSAQPVTQPEVVSNEDATEALTTPSAAESNVDTSPEANSPEALAQVSPAAAAETRFASLLQEVAESKYQVQPGDNIWNIIENKLETNGLFAELEPAQKTYLIDSLKDTVVAMSPEELKAFGIESGNPNLIRVGEELDFSKLFTEESLVASVEGAENLSDAQKESILAHSEPAVVPTVEASDTDVAEVTTSSEAQTVVEAAQQKVQHVDVPDYSGTQPETPVTTETASTEEIETTVDESASLDTTHSEVGAAVESLSKVPKEASVSEILEKQKTVENLLSQPLSRELPEDLDNKEGYEPLYAPQLSERVMTISNGTDLDKLHKLIANEMYSAYQSQEITLPAQWVHNIDYMDNKASLSEMFRGDYVEYKKMLAQDVSSLKNLSAEQIKQLGVSSGSFAEIRTGDEIKMGELIKLVMQNMAERINK